VPVKLCCSLIFVELKNEYSISSYWINNIVPEFSRFFSKQRKVLLKFPIFSFDKIFHQRRQNHRFDLWFCAFMMSNSRAFLLPFTIESIKSVQKLLFFLSLFYLFTFYFICILLWVFFIGNFSIINGIISFFILSFFVWLTFLKSFIHYKINNAQRIESSWIWGSCTFSIFRNVLRRSRSISNINRKTITSTTFDLNKQKHFEQK